MVKAKAYGKQAGNKQAAGGKARKQGKQDTSNTHNRSLLATARRKSPSPCRDKRTVCSEEMLREEKR